MNLRNGSGVNREVYAPLCYVPEHKFLRWTCHRFHRCLDIAFREDASAICLCNASANFALLRCFVLNLFRLDKGRVKSLHKKRKAAACNSQDLVDLLKSPPLQEIGYSRSESPN